MQSQSEHTFTLLHIQLFLPDLLQELVEEFRVLVKQQYCIVGVQQFLGEMGDVRTGRREGGREGGRRDRVGGAVREEGGGVGQERGQRMK